MRTSFYNAKNWLNYIYLINFMGIFNRLKEQAKEGVKEGKDAKEVLSNFTESLLNLGYIKDAGKIYEDTDSYYLYALTFDSYTEVCVAVEVKDEAGALAAIIGVLGEQDVNVEYMYGLSTEGIDAYIVMKLSNNEKANEIFTKYNIKTLSNEDIAKIK